MTRTSGWTTALALITLAQLPLTAAAQVQADDTSIVAAGPFATCAAYYFNAVNARPMSEYEALYLAGEGAFNEALQRADRKAVDDLVAKASIDMKQLIGDNWLNFHRADVRYGPGCAKLTGYRNGTPQP